jgi:hypothetical protein
VACLTVCDGVHAFRVYAGCQRAASSQAHAADLLYWPCLSVRVCDFAGFGYSIVRLLEHRQALKVGAAGRRTSLSRAHAQALVVCHLCL